MYHSIEVEEEFQTYQRTLLCFPNHPIIEVQFTKFENSYIDDFVVSFKSAAEAREALQLVE